LQVDGEPVARTGIGLLAFDGLMTVELWQPPSGDAPGDRPGRCEVVKQGRVVLGGAESIGTRT
jgi:hypothetical protein